MLLLASLILSLAQVVFLLASPNLAVAISRHHKKDIPKVKTNFIKIDECNKMKYTRLDTLYMRVNIKPFLMRSTDCLS